MPTFSRYNIRLSQIEDTPKVLSLYRDVAEKPGGLARLPFEITSHYVENFLKATVSRGLGFVAVDNNDDVVAEIHAYSPESTRGASEFNNCCKSVIPFISSTYSRFARICHAIGISLSKLPSALRMRPRISPSRSNPRLS